MLLQRVFRFILDGCIRRVQKRWRDTGNEEYRPSRGEGRGHAHLGCRRGKREPIYRGLNICDLVVHSTFEEVSYLLLHDHLPPAEELKKFQSALDPGKGGPRGRISIYEDDASDFASHGHHAGSRFCSGELRSSVARSRRERPISRKQSGSLPSCLPLWRRGTVFERGRSRSIPILN